MITRSLLRLATPLLLCLLIAQPANAAAKLSVFVSILPQQYFVERIAGGLAEVNVLVMPGANPHLYEPTPSQMARLARAKGYFAIGVALEDAWLPRINAANPALTIIRTQNGVEKIPMAESEATHDDHGHETLDPHIWLDPVRARTIAENTCKGLIAIDPANAAMYQANLAGLLADIDATHAAISSTLKVVPDDRRTFMVFHPSWGYFADRYDLTQLAIEEQGNEPSPRHLAEIIRHCRDNNIRVIFVQPQFSGKSARVIAAELDAEVVPLDPLAGDWKENLLKAADTFAQSVK